MSEDTCIDCGRVRRPGTGSKTKQLCISCYSKWYRANRKRTKTCAWCGELFETARAEVTFCGASCGGKYANSKVSDSPLWSAHQERLRATKKPRPTRKTPEEIADIRKGQRSAIRAAYEDRRWDDLITAISARTEHTADGCWEWQGKVSDGYPMQRIGRRDYFVHRLALEGKEQAHLGSQQSHHICANTRCVNPAHLQPATHVENIAEMKARRSYEDRIAELEAALAEHAPEHPVLDRVRYGAA